VFAFDDELAHVRDIEHSDVFSHGLMFIDDARVLNGHKPTRERHHFRAKPDVLVVKRCLLLGTVSHVMSLMVASSRAKVDRAVPCSMLFFPGEAAFIYRRPWSGRSTLKPLARSLTVRRMALLDKLERRLGFLAIPGLPRILVGFAALVFGLAWLLPGYVSI